MNNNLVRHCISFDPLITAVSRIFFKTIVSHELDLRTMESPGFSRYSQLAIKIKRAQDLTLSFHIEDSNFVDEHGRILMLRGINLCGNSKLPAHPYTFAPCEEFYSSAKNVSFIGRPFNLNDAKEHFQRLRTWGLTFARLLVPWEALGKCFIHEKL